MKGFITVKFLKLQTYKFLDIDLMWTVSSSTHSNNYSWKPQNQSSCALKNPALTRKKNKTQYSALGWAFL